MWRTQFVTPPPSRWQSALAGLALGMGSYFASRRPRAEPVHEALPDSELLVLPDAGHLPFVDAQARFTAAVLERLEG